MRTYFVHGEGNGNPLQYSCLENSMDGRAWWAAAHGVTKSRTRLSDFTFTLKKWQPTPVFLPGGSQGWGAWWAAVYRVAQSRTRLKRLSSSSSLKEPIFSLTDLSWMGFDYIVRVLSSHRVVVSSLYLWM